MGEGSTFWFEIPVVIASSKKDLDQIEIIQQEVQSAINSNDKLNGFVLIADDYVPNQKVAKLHLESGSHSVMVVNNGSEAVDACKSNKFDLILMDVQMPVMDGFEATKAIRATDNLCKDVPIVGLTASADLNTIEICEEVGMNDIITKPIRRESFLVAVEKWLSIQKAKINVAEDHRSLEIHKPSSSDNQDAPIDYPTAVEEFGGDEAILKEIAGQFLINAGDQIKILKKGLKEKDTEVLYQEAHRLHGGAANLLAVPLAKVAGKLEKIAQSGKLKGVEEAIQQLEKEVSRLKNAFAS